MIPSARSLLRELDRLAFPARQHRIAAIGRSADPGLPRLVAQLAGGDEYSATLALQLAVLSLDTAHIARCLHAPQPRLRASALVAAVRAGLPADVVAAGFDEMPVALRRTLYRAVRKHRDPAVADELYRAAAGRFDDAEAGALLPACSAAVVAAALPGLAHVQVSWGALATRHCAVALDHMEAELARTPRPRWPEVWNRLGDVVVVAAELAPDRAFTLLEGAIGIVPLPAGLWRNASMLARHDPARLLRILLDPRRIGPIPTSRGLWRVLQRADDPDLVALARVLNPTQLGQFLHTLPPSRRPAVYAGIVGDRDLLASGLPIDLIDDLPRDARIAEANRLLGFRSVADDEETRLAVVARTAWADAEPVLVEATTRPSADERASAYRHVIHAAAATRDPDAFGTCLASLTRLRNEQDPVRSAALAAVAAVPAWLFRSADLPVVRRLVTDAVEARDHSWQSSQSVRLLADRLIREGAVAERADVVECGLDALGRMGSGLDMLALHGLDRGLPRGAEHRVFAALRPRIEADAARGRFEVAFALANGLDRRAWGMPLLQEVIDRARHASNDAIVRTAISLWLAPQATRDERVAEVLRTDRSTITIDAVRNAVARRRTDLLDRVLTGRIRGRFLSSDVRHIPWFAGCFDRWLPRQCTRYVELLASVAENSRATTYLRVQAAHTLSGVPGAAPALGRLVYDQEVPVAEAALAGLAWTEYPADSLEELLRWTGTDRARVAVPAAARCARFLSPRTLGELLEPALDGGKITARKEAVRLVVLHRVPGAAERVARVFRAERQHRDVRRAVVSACRSLLDEPVAWQVLAEAAADPATATAIVETRLLDIPERHRARYAVLVRIVAGAPDPVVALPALQVISGWADQDPGAVELLTGLTTDLARTSTWHAAARALVVHAVRTGRPDVVVEAVRALLAVRDVVGPDRDLPARQRVLDVARMVVGSAGSDSGRRIAAALAGALTEETYRESAVELLLAAHPWERADPAGLLAAHEQAETSTLRDRASGTVRRRTEQVVSRLPPDDLLAMATALVAGAPAFALAVVTVAGAATGWATPWRDLLAGLRTDPDPDVRRAALSTFTSPER
ncbi:hypothetical protein [Pseudonocardia sp. TRM90224]|uniref:hypothetical protein n=1 Tax=Pseudonocardia sp. TRM90224 TaxID=2812678 RepID=UPI001E5549C0|nr:hypothetical protein [Pseudonocardia sp. TRM90224]